MSFQLSSGDRKILLIATAVFVALVIGAMLFVTPESNQASLPTTYSADSSGAKAALLLLQERGYRARRHEQPPGEIRTCRNTTLILAEPSRYPNKEEQSSLHNFILQGGTLIAIGESASWALPKNAVKPTPLEGMTWEKFPARSASAITQAAQQITMAPQSYWALPQSAQLLYGTEYQPVVVRYLYGAGSVIWWASATPLTNAGLREPGNLEFFLACLGDKTKTRILWDEYFHGYRHSEKFLFEKRIIAGILLQLGLFGIVIILTFSRRSGPIRPSSSEIRLSPLEFVETLGSLYERAHASIVAVDIYYQRFLYWLTKRLGMSKNDSIEKIEQAIRSRWNFQDAEFAETLRSCASVRYHSDLPPRQALKLIRSLHDYATQLKLFPGSIKESNRWKRSRNY